MNRRTFIALSSSCILPFSGCLNDKLDIYPLTKIFVTNKYGSEVNINITICVGDEKVYESNEEIPPNTDVKIRKNWMGDSLNYIITVSLSENNKERITTSDISNRFELQENNCIMLDFTIEANKQIAPFVTDTRCDGGSDSSLDFSE